MQALQALLDALLAAGCSLACVDPGGGSFPLLAAAQLGWEPMLRLLRRGADPNQAREKGEVISCVCVCSAAMCGGGGLPSNLMETSPQAA